MRAWLPILLLLITLPASAQEPCSAQAPCLIPLDMDDASLSFGGAAEFWVTAGDTISFDAFNTDDVAHEVAVADLGIEFTVEPFADSVHGPYLMDAPGDYTITDITTGATATLHVVLEDVSTGDGSEPNQDGSGLTAIVAALALAAVALLRRR